jgi:glycosyltransferase involved in cell wall biosynthesis
LRIVYDHRIFSQQPHGGVPRYILELASEMAELERGTVSILALAHMNDYLRSAPAGVVRGRYVPHVPRTGWLRHLVNDTLAGVSLRWDPPDILHETYYSGRRLAPARTRTVVTVYDMIHERYPEMFRSGDRTVDIKREAVGRADHVICISESTRRELLELHDVDPAKTSVVHLACRPPNGNPPAPPPVKGAYLLYVGQRRGYKNFGTSLVAFASSTRLASAFRLVCFGGGAFSYSERNEMSRLRLAEDRVLQLSGNDRLLSALYANAAALVYPSLCEGFGMPPLEAMALGCPVVCSGISSLPEVVGDAAELFDPADVDSIAHALENVLFSSERADGLREAGKQRVRAFSWRRCATETHAIYRSLL